LPDYKSLAPRNLKEVGMLEANDDYDFGGKIINFNLQMFEDADSEP